ncbi:MAG TPA: hypothetical protein VHE83_02585 [Mycobacteriales bacterium]|nr:hypothetical protein [Mycobacteriales bacterium]
MHHFFAAGLGPSNGIDIVFTAIAAGFIVPIMFAVAKSKKDREERGGSNQTPHEH